MDPTEVKKANFCPYLGLVKDADTHFDFPSYLNCCHRLARARPVRLEVQETNCLTAAHFKCPVYAGKVNGGGWKGFQTQSTGARFLSTRWKHLIWLLPGLLVLLLGLGVLGVLTSRMIKAVSPAPSQGMNPPTIQYLIASAVALTDAAATAGAVAAAATEAAPATRVPASAVAGVSIDATATNGVINSNGITATPVPSLSPTATLPAGPPTPGPGIATPFGPLRGEQGGYLLHRVESGETLASLALTYNTTVAVLAAANQPVEVHLTALAMLSGADVQVSDARLPPDILLVVLPHQTDPAGVPRFRVVFVEEQVQVLDLVAREGVSVDDLRYYNALGGSVIPPGRWLIIPEYP